MEEVASNSIDYANDALDKLTPLQMSTLDTLITAKNLKSAARMAGVSPSSVYKWLGEPNFRNALMAIYRARFDALNLEAMRVGQEALGTMETIMKDTTNPPFVRAKAAADLLSFVFKGYETSVIAARLDALEQRLGDDYGAV